MDWCWMLVLVLNGSQIVHWGSGHAKTCPKISIPPKPSIPTSLPSVNSGLCSSVSVSAFSWFISNLRRKDLVSLCQLSFVSSSLSFSSYSFSHLLWIVVALSASLLEKTQLWVWVTSFWSCKSSCDLRISVRNPYKPQVVRSCNCPTHPLNVPNFLPASPTELLGFSELQKHLSAYYYSPSNLRCLRSELIRYSYIFPDTKTNRTKNGHRRGSGSAIDWSWRSKKRRK